MTSRLTILRVRARENGELFFWSGGWPTTATNGSGWLEVRKYQHLRSLQQSEIDSSLIMHELGNFLDEGKGKDKGRTKVWPDHALALVWPLLLHSCPVHC